MNFPTFTWLDKVLCSFVRLKSPIRFDEMSDVIRVENFDQIAAKVKSLENGQSAKFLIHISNIPASIPGGPVANILLGKAEEMKEHVKIDGWLNNETQEVLLEIKLLYRQESP